jgi:hypothetical protein
MGKILRQTDIRPTVFPGEVDIGNKLIASVVVIGHKLIAGVMESMKIWNKV